MRPRGKMVTPDVAPSDHLAARDGDHHRISLCRGSSRRKEGCPPAGSAASRHEVPWLARDNVERPAIAFDVLELHRLDAELTVFFTLGKVFSIPSSVNSFIAQARSLYDRRVGRAPIQSHRRIGEVRTQPSQAAAVSIRRSTPARSPPGAAKWFITMRAPPGRTPRGFVERPLGMGHDADHIGRKHDVERSVGKFERSRRRSPAAR